MEYRREYQLPPSDANYLEAFHNGWETVRDGAAAWLLLPGYALPDEYNHQLVTVALRIEPGYPDTQIDMVYFSPAISRKDGVAIGAIGSQKKIDGKVFQRWSRHRTSENPWQPGEDCVETHMLLVKNWLEREFQKCAT